jgi:metal transporter CNNM
MLILMMLRGNSFQTGTSHILLISSQPGKDIGMMGIVTLEDVVEVSSSDQITLMGG